MLLGPMIEIFIFQKYSIKRERKKSCIAATKLNLIVILISLVFIIHLASSSILTFLQIFLVTLHIWSGVYYIETKGLINDTKKLDPASLKEKFRLSRLLRLESLDTSNCTFSTSHIFNFHLLRKCKRLKISNSSNITRINIKRHW